MHLSIYDGGGFFTATTDIVYVLNLRVLTVYNRYLSVRELDLF